MFEFTLQGSGLEDNEVKVVVSIGAALKIYEYNHRASAVLTIKEFFIPTTDSKDEGLMTSVLSFEPSIYPSIYLSIYISLHLSIISTHLSI